MGNFFWIYKVIEKQLFFISQPILKSSDLTIPRYVEQSLSVSSELVKTNSLYDISNCILDPALCTLCIMYIMGPVKHLKWTLLQENIDFELTLGNYFCKKFNSRCLKGSQLIKYFRIHESIYQFWNY